MEELIAVFTWTELEPLFFTTETNALFRTFTARWCLFFFAVVVNFFLGFETYLKKIYLLLAMAREICTDFQKIPQFIPGKFLPPTDK